MTATKRRAKCRHCREHYQCRPKGLCWNCSTDPRIRKRYTSESKFAAKGLGLTPPKRKARRPCKAAPGSEGRLATYRRRLERGEELYHAEDAKL